ncbi:PLP-dependent transferase [Neolentinus lepideus HHB14362 ss-1]|uniref:PLP-dependent transferase n=1 Tax=Neolentinus lepideus HHB14362 ss-1 TaxID=1314782 RepID=A0A165RQH8_9AGAM|nr:PLP-dependent transferase [Neolentinus lepideus HHB14362 ss-1]
MSLSNRGSQRTRLLAPGGQLYNFFRRISDEWEPDYREGVVQLDISENDLMWPELIHKNLTVQDAHKWPSISGRMLPSCSSALLASFASLLGEYFKPHKPLTSDHLVGGAGCTLLLEQVVRAITDPGDVILIPVPFWSMFATIVAKADVTLCPLPTIVNESDGFIPSGTAIVELESLLKWSDATEIAWHEHIAQLAREGKRSRAILLTNPQNPLGRCYSREYLCRIADFCEKEGHDLFLISDEVFALSVHDPTVTRTYLHHRHLLADSHRMTGFHSILSLEADKETICKSSRFVVLWSMSKDFGVSHAR